MADIAEQEAMLLKKYGRIPKKKTGPVGRVNGDRKFFDSADQAMNSAGIKSADHVGKVIPTAANLQSKSLRVSTLSQGNANSTGDGDSTTGPSP
eukprot:m.46893 g.46893  ORF g.46893 m.46893 type:complete len:94 (+) comp15189_c0_seq1:151-432(+)